MLIHLDDYRLRRAARAAMPIELALASPGLAERGIATCGIGAAACALAEVAPDQSMLPEWELADLFAGATLV